MKGKISKRILAVLCAVTVVMTSISFPFPAKAEGETVTKFQDTKYADWTKVTFDDIGWENGTYSPGGDLTTKYGLSLEGKVFSGYVTFSEDKVSMYMCGASLTIWGGMCLRSGEGDNLKFSIGGVSHTLDPKVANVTLVNNTFNLKFSFDTLDADEDGTKDTLKLGVWIDDVLYNNEYITVTSGTVMIGQDQKEYTYATYLTGALGIYGSGKLKIHSDRPETLPDLDEISFDAFGWENGTYNYKSDISVKYGHQESLAGKVFSGDVKFSSNSTQIYIGGGQEGIWSGLKIASGVGEDALQMGFGGETYTFTSDIAGTKLIDNSFNLKLSYQLEDNNMDGENDTLKLGVWFNNVLYNNKYIRLSNNETTTYVQYLTGGLGIYTPGSAGGKGELTIASVKPGVIGQYITETNTGDMNRVPYNNNEITADLNVGVAGFPVVVDMNKDGYMDLLIGSNSVVYSGTHVFYGNADSKDSLVMDKGRQITKNGNTFRGTYLYDENGKYEKTMLHMAVDPSTGSQTAKYVDASTYPSMTKVLATRLYGPFPATIEGVVSNSYNFMQQTMADYDGDGMLDMITAWDCWSEYSDVGSNVSGVKFNTDGVWDGDDDDNEEDVIHGWVMWNKNTGTSIGSGKYANEGLGELVMVYEYTTDAEGNKTIVADSEHALDTYGSPNPQFYDWDHDGDLDIVCASFISKITYYENIGSATAPVYIEGREMPLGVLQSDETWKAGTASLEFELAMPQLTCFDWNGDGWMDILCSEEDGRLSISLHTGTTDNKGTPIMQDYRYFQTPADNLKVGALSTPVSVDWDGDGDEDIITGNSAGYIDFIKNLSIENNQPLTNPIWDNPVHLTNPEGEVYRIMAGDDLSCQGPSEAKWGYTQVSVADWDGDGVLDIMSNNIVGQVYIHKGIKGKPYQISNPEKIYVEWENGNDYPDWLWWIPEGNSLVTLWRTTPFMIDLPLDEDEDGKAEGDGLMDLVIMDSDGYLSFFQRYSDNGTLKLKEGKQIFKKGNSNTILGFNADLKEGKSGKINYILTDFDMDGKLDLIRNYELNFFFYKNIATTPGDYIFDATGVRMHPTRKLQDHTPCPSVCDWNLDGVPDLLAGTMDGCFYYMTNTIYAPDTTPEEETKEFAGYTYVTPEDFGFDDKDYTVITNASKRPASVDKLMFQATVNFKTDNFASGVMYMMKQGSTSGDWSLRLKAKNNWGLYLVNMFGTDMGVKVYDGATGDEIPYNSQITLKCSTAFPDGSVTYQNIVGSTFKLGFTSEYVDFDDDSEQDDIKLGIWFNGVLYNNQYFYLTNCTNGDNTVVPNFKVNLNGGGTTSIASPTGCQMEVQPEITDSIAMKYQATIDPMLLKIAEPYMNIAAGEDATITVKGTPVAAGSNIYTFTYPGLMPQDMAQDIKASIAVGTNSKEYTHSMLGYCAEILNTQWPQEGTVLGCATSAQLADLKDLVVDLVEYGASVQTYRKVAKSELLTAKLASVVSNYESFDQTDDDASALASLGGVSSKLTQDSDVAESTAYKWKNVTLVLGNKIKIRARFTADNVTNLKVKVAIGEEEKEIAYKKDTQAGVYVLDFDEIYAYENGTPIALKFYTGSVQVGKTLHYSVNTYLNEMRESTVENLPALLLAIHNYGKAALTYKNSYASAAE